ncbi:hypothetical protein DL96DRAFT_1686270 [Flagelloscypha sp. PMI_526]|nr:hypothetical protein DL96DRAFT_1686270 [Flagelloscypha sp. PMI_526]
MSIPLSTLSSQRPEPGSSPEDSLLSHQDEPQSRELDSIPRQTKERPWYRRRFLTTLFGLSGLNVLAHSILVTLHIALIVIMLLRVERSVIINVGKQTAYWTSVMRIVLQAFAIAYLALMLYLTQRIALRQSLTRRQYLTCSHDQSSAWLGLGSGFKVLYSQTTVNSGASMVVLIVAYLLGCAAIKTTTAAIFEFVPVNQTTAGTQVANQLLDQANLGWFSSRNAKGADNLTAWLSPYLLMSGRGQLDQLGVDGNVVYEVPKPSTVLVNASVNTYTTNVKCGYISYENQSTFFSDSRQYRHSQRIRAGWLNFGGPVLNLVNPIAPNPAQIDPLETLETLVIFSSFNISDSAGNYASRRDRAGLQVRWTKPAAGGFPFVYFPESRELLQGADGNWTRWVKEIGYQSSDDSYQLVGCQSSSQTQSNVTVNGSNGKLVAPPVRKTSSTWEPSEKHVVTDSLNWMFLTNGVAQPGVGDDFGRASSYKTGTSIGRESFSTPLSPAEFWIRNRLQLPIPVNRDRYSNDRGAPPELSGLPVFQNQQPTVMLHDLENALEDYLALSIWSLQKDQPNSTSLLVFENGLVSQLQLIRIPVYAGFAVSCLLLAAACVVIFSPTRDSSRVLVKTSGRQVLHGLGLLEVLWLAKAIPELEKMETPEEEDLRKAGLFRVCLLDGLNEPRVIEED